MSTSVTGTQSSKRLLDPIDRVSEVLFGLIMVLTFTGSLSVAEAGRDGRPGGTKKSPHEVLTFPEMHV